jgi:hypothetical protein
VLTQGSKPARGCVGAGRFVRPSNMCLKLTVRAPYIDSRPLRRAARAARNLSAIR